MPKPKHKVKPKNKHKHKNTNLTNAIQLGDTYDEYTTDETDDASLADRWPRFSNGGGGSIESKSVGLSGGGGSSESKAAGRSGDEGSSESKAEGCSGGHCFRFYIA